MRFSSDVGMRREVWLAGPWRCRRLVFWEVKQNIPCKRTGYVAAMRKKVLNDLTEVAPLGRVKELSDLV